MIKNLKFLANARGATFVSRQTKRHKSEHRVFDLRNFKVLYMLLSYCTTKCSIESYTDRYSRMKKGLRAVVKKKYGLQSKTFLQRRGEVPSSALSRGSVYHFNRIDPCCLQRDCP